MFIFVGIGIVMFCSFGAYIMFGGNIGIIAHALPKEMMMIGGVALGATIVANPTFLLKRFIGGIKAIIKGPHHDKDSFLELLTLLYTLFKMIKTKGILSIEAHIEKPEESELFKKFPHFMHDHHAPTFLCDYLRMWTLGTDNHHELESIIDLELETHHQEEEQVSGAIQNLADGLPAIGIVAAVLGVIKTMGSIDQPPPILGGMIGGALVGTFLGVFLAYGIFGPMAAHLKTIHAMDGKYYLAIKAALLAHMQGYAPSVSVEFARKGLVSHLRPSFFEVEEACSKVTL
jgi:chemotaxis protein MotA